MKTLQSSNNTSSASGRGGAYAPNSRAGYATSVAAENEPTRQWLMLLESPDTGRGIASAAGSVFGAPLKDVVSSLSPLQPLLRPFHVQRRASRSARSWQRFNANFLESPRVTPRASVAGSIAGQPLSREEARHLYLPAVVRCVEASRSGALPKKVSIESAGVAVTRPSFALTFLIHATICTSTTSILPTSTSILSAVCLRAICVNCQRL